MCIYFFLAALHALGLLLLLNIQLLTAGLGLDDHHHHHHRNEKHMHSLAASGLPHNDIDDLHSINNDRTDHSTTTTTHNNTASTFFLYEKWRGAAWLHITAQALASAMALPLLAGLTVLVLWNLRLLMYNKTTIEYHEGVNAIMPLSYTHPQQSIKKTTTLKKKAHHPYDLGSIKANVVAVMGANPLKWVVPIDPSAEGQGLLFPTSLHGDVNR